VKKGQEWSAKQLEYLRLHYPSERAEDIGAAIGKTKGSVQHKAHRLNIHKDKAGFFDARSKAMRGENSGNFKGYRRKTKKGYVALYKPDHPSAGIDGLVLEHRYIMENALGFQLPDSFDVHHINGKKDDNRIENLVVMTHKAHTILHNRKGRGKHE